MFCYLKLDASDLPSSEIVEFRSKFEDALNPALLDANAGGCIGGGSGLRYAYIDLALTDIKRAAPIIRKVLAEHQAPTAIVDSVSTTTILRPSGLVSIQKLRHHHRSRTRSKGPGELLLTLESPATVHEVGGAVGGWVGDDEKGGEGSGGIAVVTVGGEGDAVLAGAGDDA